MGNKTWLIVVVVGAIILFYWFGLRPAQIRKDCSKASSGSERVYDRCLQQHGLE